LGSFGVRRGGRPPPGFGETRIGEPIDRPRPDQTLSPSGRWRRVVVIAAR
jgi:hypothetical protein